MSYHADIKAARLAAEKTAFKAPTATNFKQHGLLNQLELRAADLKRAVAEANAAGGLLDANANAALTALLGSL